MCVFPLHVTGLRTKPLEEAGSYRAFRKRMSIGETAIMPTAAVIANAVEDAVGVRIKSLLITGEKVLEALKGR